MPTLDVNGDRLHFTDEGEGPVVVMVHGSCGGGAQWRRFSQMLGERYRKICVDLPGMGDSQPYPLGRVWSGDDDRDAVVALIDHLDAPLHFVGHSGGCLFSWPALQARADRITSVTLFEPVFFDHLYHAGNPLHAWVQGMAGGYRDRVEDGDMEGALTHFVDGWAGGAGAWAALPDKVQAMMRKGGPRLYHEWAARIIPRGTPPDLAYPAAPTLVVEGADTHAAMHAICDLVVKARPNASQLTIPGAGHMAPFTHAAIAAAATTRHIEAA